MDTIVSVVGLLGVLILSLFVKWSGWLLGLDSFFRSEFPIQKLSSALSLQLKNFPGDVSAQIILIKQPAQAAGLAAYQGWARQFMCYGVWFSASLSAS